MRTASHVLSIAVERPLVRDAGPVDTEFVVDLVVQGVWNKNFILNLDDDSALKALALTLHHSILKNRIDGPDGSCWSRLFVLAFGAERVGFLWLMEHEVERRLRTIDIHAMSVLPPKRGMGYGRQLLYFALDLVEREFPRHGMSATCHPQSIVMRGMLERNGFLSRDSTPDATQFVLDRRGKHTQHATG
jgi:GNAT superfamily N-acetyltransferase